MQLIHGDCLDVMKTLPDASVSLVVTSPPYNCGKVYGENTDSLPINDYWEFTAKWLACSWRVLSDNGRLAVNLPWWMGKKPRLEVPFTFHRLALEAGFRLLDKVIWVKGTNKSLHVSGGWGGGGSGWGTWLSPSGPAIRCASEPILIFSKGQRRGRGVVSGNGRGDCLKGDASKEEFLEWTVDVWMVRGRSDASHPAVFPIEIPKRLVGLYTFPGETVLDPFMGIGTTGKACQQGSREFIGIEKEAAYIEIARKRLAEVEASTPLFQDKGTR